MTRVFIRYEGDRQQLAAIVDGALSAVTFVRDYIQLHFDGPAIDAFSLPCVLVAGCTLAHDDHGYRDALCARIGADVIAAYVDPGEQLRIDFSDGASFVISLRPVDRIGPGLRSIGMR